MPSPEQEAAEALVGAAAEDEAAVRELVENPRVGDSVIGFHAQQAIEKLLKAVLASKGIDYAFTHDLSRLLDQVGRSDLPAKLQVESVVELTPWATEFRYGGSSASELDRAAALRVIEAVRDWAVGEVRG